MWQNSCGKFKFIKYNAWENDYWDNPFEPLMQTIFSDEIFINAFKKDNLIETRNHFFSALKEMFKGICKKKMSDFIDEGNLENAFRNLKSGTENFIGFLTGENAIFKDYLEFTKQLNLFRSSLEEILAKYDSNIIILIDELDRCNPYFAIKTLEFVKHIFNVKGLRFCIAIDMEQLGNSISTIYGAKVNSAGYLYRFFDYISKLPKINDNVFMKSLVENDNFGTFDDKIKETLFELMSVKQITFRETQMFYNAFKYVYNSELRNAVDFEYFQTYINAIFVKVVFPDVFNNFSVKTNGKRWDTYLESVGINESKYTKINGENIFSILYGRTTLIDLTSTNGANYGTLKFYGECDSGKLKYGKENGGYGIKTEFAETGLGKFKFPKHLVKEKDLSMWTEIMNLSPIDFVARTIEGGNFKIDDSQGR